MLLGSLLHVATVKPALELADVFAAHFDDYLQVAYCTSEQFAAVNAILRCRTAALSGHLRVCDVCGRVQLVYNSCGNRNCPKPVLSQVEGCGAFERAQWLLQQGARLLPVPHFHVVFTLDHRVNPLAEVNPEAIYDLLFTTANQTLKAFAQQYPSTSLRTGLGGQIGVTAVLHILRQAQDRPWGQTLQHHIHLHCMVTAGALAQTPDPVRLPLAQVRHRLPVPGRGALAAISGRFLCRVAASGAARRVTAGGGLRRPGRGGAQSGDAGSQVGSIFSLAKSYIGKPPKSHRPEVLLKYMSRYFRRTAISNPRLVALENGQVTFTYYDNRERDEAERGQPKTMTLPAVEFIRRFLTHVLPFQFKRVRHFGLYASAKRAVLGVARGLLGHKPELPQPAKLDLAEWLASFVTGDPFACPFCGVGRMRPGREFAPIRGFALWLLILLGLPVAGRSAA